MHQHSGLSYTLVKDLSDSTSIVELKADSSGRLVTLTNEHYNIHRGNYYGIGYFNTSIANGSSIQVIMETPTTADAHTAIKLIAGGDATFQLYEGVTYTAAGTSITPQNHNRCFTNSSSVVASHTPTGASGTEIWQEFVPGGTGVATAPGAISARKEQAVFCRNDIYMFELTNTSGVAQPLQIIIDFYEVT